MGNFFNDGYTEYADLDALREHIARLEGDNLLLAEKVAGLIRADIEKEARLHQREGQATYVLQLGIDALKEAGVRQSRVQNLPKREPEPWIPMADDSYIAANGVRMTILQEGNEIFVQDSSGHDTIIVLSKNVRLCACREEAADD